MVRDRLGAGTGQASPMLFGCSAGGVIGGGREVENRAGISLTVAHLPGVEMSPFHVEGDDLPDMDAGPNAWEVALNLSANREPQFLLLVDPFSFPTQDFIAGLDYAFNSGAKVGGMASGGRQRGENALFLGDAVPRSGGRGHRHVGQHRGGYRRGPGLPSHRAPHGDYQEPAEPPIGA